MTHGRPSCAACIAVLALCSTFLPGCSKSVQGAPDVRAKIGRSGTGQMEFVYPRCIDRFPDGTLAVLDKTGRIQLFAPDGKFERVIQMPLIQSGKPTGVSISPDGEIYVPDTHYSRVIVYSRDGRLLRQWGSYGEGDGQFRYPTDVAFLPDGRVLVSEYGGHDRISIFTREGKFLGAFGSYGSGDGELSRPQSMAIDAARGRLYVTDACNHRIAMYNLRCELEGYIGSPGSELGQLRYPYGLALTKDGRLVVVENGNNRVQVFSPDGKGLAVMGVPGRDMGQLMYPWAVTVDDQGLAYVVDGGNDRIQVWKLPS